MVYRLWTAVAYFDENGADRSSYGIRLVFLVRLGHHARKDRFQSGVWTKSHAASTFSRLSSESPAKSLTYYADVYRTVQDGAGRSLLL